MKTIRECIQSKKKRSMDKITAQANKIKLNRSATDTNVHWYMTNIGKSFGNQNISYLFTDINLHNFFLKDKKTINENFRDLFVEFYEDGEPGILEYREKIEEDIKDGKSIFICVDFFGYGCDEEDKHDYSTHSVSIMLIPMSTYYKLIFINSHGNDITKEFDIFIAKTRRPRIKKIKFNTSIDVVFVKNLVSNLNEYLAKKNCKLVRYNGDEKDTYCGANLQCGDSYGICYAYPYIFYNYFCQYYKKSRQLENLVIPSSYKLLSRGKITQFVHACIADFNKNFKEKIIEIENSENKKYLKSIEEIIELEGTKFVNDIANPLISYINQKKFKQRT